MSRLAALIWTSSGLHIRIRCVIFVLRLPAQHEKTRSWAAGLKRSADVVLCHVEQTAPDPLGGHAHDHGHSSGAVHVFHDDSEIPAARRPVNTLKPGIVF
jgi:hypothetical protein